MKLLMPTVSGWLSDRVVRVRPITNSFQAEMKVKTTAVTMPGIASGSTTFRRVPNRPSPSSIAASSSATGMEPM